MVSGIGHCADNRSNPNAAEEPRLPDLDLTGWTIAFDLDGTLVETAPDLIAALNVILAEHGLPSVPVDAARHMVGHGAIAMTRKGFEAGGRPFPEEQSREILDRF